jgi:hypothetical protein
MKVPTFKRYDEVIAIVIIITAWCLLILYLASLVMR